MDLDGIESYVGNTFEMTDQIKKLNSPEIQERNAKFNSEKIELGGRFWVFEGLFDPQDRILWLEAIEILGTINNLVQEDIRDYLLHYSEENRLNEEKKQFAKKESKKQLLIVRGNSSRDRAPSVKGKRGQVKKKTQGAHDKSYESDDESIMINKAKIPLKLDGLRPPHVWNFPIQILQNIKRKAEHDDEKRNEIRIIDPTDPKIYRDGRVKKFLEYLNKIKFLMMQYCEQQKDNIWKDYYDKTLEVINHIHHIRMNSNHDKQGNILGDI
jgi:hypothetical protein